METEPRKRIIAKPRYALAAAAFGLAVVGGLAAPKVGPSPSSAVDAREKLSALAERAQLRAYFGAPPVVPHEIDQLDSEAECLNCHGGEAGSDDENPKLPHTPLASCTQCHVVQELDLFLELDVAANEFSGLEEPTGGQRAWTGAPPTIPHSTLMRNRCLSCHGPTARAGIRSSHPERLSCQQCHTPSAKLNQHLVGDAAMPLPSSRVKAP